jgi:hypothetical protein
MTPPNARLVEGRKFMWDGQVYPSREEAVRAKTAYESDGFETRIFEEQGTFLVYTRRAVQAAADKPA